MTFLKSVLTAVLAAGLCNATITCSPEVETSHGTLRGGTCNATKVNYFLSVPYANPPKRFEAPVPYSHKYRERDATVPAPACPQFGTTFIETGPQSEDCLFLDIFVPADKSPKSKLPVKVWIYGGSEEAGGISNAMYTGCNAAQDVIQVNINYRVGPLGFLSLTKAGIHGNFGIQDLLLALKWIKENIGNFGGDSEKLALFGQSAGSFNTFVIATLDEAPELISAAIMQSGGGSDFASVAEAQPWNELFATILGCHPSDLSCINHKNVTELQRAVLAMPSGVGPSIGSPIAHLGRGYTWGPLVDQKVIPRPPASVGVKVPSIFGSTASEGTLFVLGTYASNFTTQIQATYNEFLSYQFGPLASKVNSTYPISKFAPSAFSPNPVDTAIGTVLTEYEFKCSAYRGLKQGFSNGVPVYTYFFSHVPSCTWLTSVPNNAFVHGFLGATHTAELPFVFGVLDGLPAPGGNCSSTAYEATLSQSIIASWDSMSAVHSPGCGWPRWSPSNGLGVTYSSNEITVGEVDYSVCEFWDGIRDELVSLQSRGQVSGP